MSIWIRSNIISNSPAVSAEDLSAAVTAYDEILSSSFKQFTELSAKLGGDVAKLGAMVDAAFKAQRAFLAISAKSKQPSQQDMQMLLKPTSDKISEIQEFREKGRRSEHFNHLSAISESIPALGWVAVVSLILFNQLVAFSTTFSRQPSANGLVNPANSTRLVKGCLPPA